jgi:hypothetical protein
MAKSFKDVLNVPFKPIEIRTPRQVLDELASSLRQKVSYTVSFDVFTSSSAERVVHSLRVSVQRIDYELELISVSHRVLDLYPARVSGLLMQAVREVSTEDELFDVLAAAFNTPKATDILGTLLAQSKS